MDVLDLANLGEEGALAPVERGLGDSSNNLPHNHERHQMGMIVQASVGDAVVHFASASEEECYTDSVGSCQYNYFAYAVQRSVRCRRPARRADRTTGTQRHARSCCMGLRRNRSRPEDCRHFADGIVQDHRSSLTERIDTDVGSLPVGSATGRGATIASPAVERYRMPGTGATDHSHDTAMGSDPGQPLSYRRPH